jgi:ribosomal protein S18 acetylase RimI-like enzyme
MARVEPATLRRATAADVDAIAGVGERSWRATYPGIVPDAVLDEWIESAPAGWRQAFAGQPSENPWRTWVAERDGVIIGYATTTAAKSDWLPPPDGAGELTNLYLDPGAIGRGIGSALYDHAIEDLRARGYNPLVVWAFRDNERAIRFYEHKGLVIDVPDHDWVLGGVPCPIVRFRIDWPVTASE